MTDDERDRLARLLADVDAKFMERDDDLDWYWHLRRNRYRNLADAVLNRSQPITGGSGALPGPLRPMAETVHHCPPANTGLTLCCHRSPFELPATDRLTVTESDVTCRG